jgi:hypothetical protein
MVKVVHDGEAEHEVKEWCCKCFIPTNYWNVKKDVALCPECAKKTALSELPSKEGWILRVGQLQNILGALGIPKANFGMRLTPDLVETIYTRMQTHSVQGKKRAKIQQLQVMLNNQLSELRAELDLL